MSRAQEMLLDFLRDHDGECPVCGYNVKGLTRPVCPECRQELVLSVGAVRFRLGWLLAALAPGFFSGIAAFFVFLMISVHVVFLGSTWPMIVAVDLFGWCSGVFAIVLARKRVRFLAQSRSWQRWFAIIVWLIHIAALGMFILIGVAYG